MARCLEIRLLDKKTFSVLGGITDWEAVKGEAAKVDRIGDLSGPQNRASIYRVQPATGPERHYIVTEE